MRSRSRCCTGRSVRRCGKADECSRAASVDLDDLESSFVKLLQKNWGGYSNLDDTRCSTTYSDDLTPVFVLTPRKTPSTISLAVAHLLPLGGCVCTLLQSLLQCLGDKRCRGTFHRGVSLSWRCQCHCLCAREVTRRRACSYCLNIEFFD